MSVLPFSRKAGRSADERLAHDPEQDKRAPCPCHTGLRDTRWAGRGPVARVFGRKDEEGFRPCHRRWMDHTYRLRTPEGTVYVAEPYELDEDAFADFVALDKAGWDVGVTAWEARHYPGHTIAVHIRKRTT